MSEGQKWRPPVAPKPNLRPANDSVRDVSSALRGATAAFTPAAAKPAAATGTKPVGNGALNAATFAEKHGRPQEQKRAAEIRTARSPARGRSQLSLDLQKVAEQTSRLESRNPLQRTASEIAARAASASSSPARSQATLSSRPGSPQGQRRSVSRDSSISSRSRLPSDASTRDARLGATLSMFASPSTPNTSPFSNKNGKLDFNKIPSLAQQVTNPVTAQRQPPPKPQKSSLILDTAASDVAEARDSIPPPPPKRQLQQRREPEPSATVDAPRSATTPTVTLSRPDDQPRTKTKPPPASPTRKASQPIPMPLKRSARSYLNSYSSPHAPEVSPGNNRGGMTANSLADAMVASSLASSRQGSRAASPAKYKPPPVPRRRSQSVDLLRPSTTGDKHPPLKPLAKRPMKHTLRKQSPEAEEEDDTRRGRKHLIRKHPHMHNEGARKRWRDKVSESERKRYEGVWAANRGLLHDYETSTVLRQRPQDSGQEDLVLGVVVRDIWSRSRLPQDVLEEVWDLVSPEEDYKALNRERFVVGMWLIDQRLKGRKLPVKVSASVWQSVRLMGIKISSKPF